MRRSSIITHFSRSYYLCLVLISLGYNHASASDFLKAEVEHCSNKQGGGICPLGNTCCPLWNNSASSNNSNNNKKKKTGSSSSACIPSDLGAHFATCCPDDGVSGCGVGYRCSTQQDDGSDSFCIATAQIQDPLVQILPRYAPLCYNSQFSNFQQMHGFSSSKFGFYNQTLKMPYYSSHGDITKLLTTHKEQQQQASSIRVVIIVIHGANRNADDYFCSISSAVRLQTHYSIHQVLVLAPRFLVPSDNDGDDVDGADESPNNNYFLKWQDTKDGPWRYGANAILPQFAQNISSFDVVDAMVQHVQEYLPSLELLTLVGHSSGGQFVQRWSLMSPFFYPVDFQQQQSSISLSLLKRTLNMQAVVANPSSYAYLTPERYNKARDTWSKPDVSACPEYDHWEWGLKPNNHTPPYVQRVLNDFWDPPVGIPNNHPYKRLVDRFASRRVIYLQGGLDRCNVSTTEAAFNENTTAAAPWCQSHGLETTCMDQLQGSNRWERNALYMSMLHRIGVISEDNNTQHHNHNHHIRIVVPMVGHDHTLMFTSRPGLQVLFGKHHHHHQQQQQLRNVD